MVRAPEAPYTNSTLAWGLAATKAVLSASPTDARLAAAATVIVAYETKFFDNFATQFTAIDPKPFYDTKPEFADATAFRNSSIQGGYLILAVRALGLDCGAMSGFDNAKVNAEFFPDGRFKSNFLLNIGRADPKGIWPRGPRLPFNDAAQIL